MASVLINDVRTIAVLRESHQFRPRSKTSLKSDPRLVQLLDDAQASG